MNINKHFNNYIKSNFCGLSARTLAQVLADFMRTGLIPPEDQKPNTKGTISTISMDPLAFHLGLVLIPALVGYIAGNMISDKFGISIPEFCMALIFGFIFNFAYNKLKTDKYIDRGTINRISGTCTDFLIVCGLGSISPSIVIKYAVPIFVLCFAGFIINFVWFIVVGKHSSPKDWFERDLMVWGQACGVTATGILLMRVVDPDLRSRGIEDSGIANLLARPIITLLTVVPPIVICNVPAGSHIVTWVTFAVFVALCIMALVFKWWRPKYVAPMGTHIHEASGGRVDVPDVEDID